MNAADLGNELYKLCQRDEESYDLVADRYNIESIGSAMIYLSDEVDGFDAIDIGSALKYSTDQVEETIEEMIENEELDEELRKDIGYVKENEVDFFLSEIEDLDLLEQEDSLYRTDGEPPFPSYNANFGAEELSMLLKSRRSARRRVSEDVLREAPKTFGTE